MVNTQHFIENDMTELTKYLIKLKHEPGFTLIVSEFINKYKADNFDSTFEEYNAITMKQLLKNFSGT